MRYNPPYGDTDPEPTLGSEPYVNGDPSIGRAGSIPPAGSIEYPQREIVAVIQWAADKGLIDQNHIACAAPSNTDLTQLLKAIFGIVGRTILTASVDLYVNPTGSDSYDGTAATHTSGTVGPFATLQKALNTVGQFQPGTYGATIHLSAGTHTATAGHKTVTWPHCNVAIDGAGSSTILTSSGSAPYTLAVLGASTYTITNLEFGSSSNYSSSFGGIVTGNAAATVIMNGGITFTGNNSAPGGNAFYSTAGSIVINNALTLNANPGSTGGAFFSASGSGAAISFQNSAVITVPNACTVNNFVEALNNAVVSVSSTAPCSFTGAGVGSVTGKKYSASFNGVINTQTANANFFPGGTAGTTSTGGQYG